MKTIFSTIIAAGILLATMPVNAQTIADFKKMEPKQKARLIADSLKTTLSLSDGQYRQVYDESLSAIEKLAPQGGNTTGRKRNFKEMKTFMAAEEVKLKQVLTASQYALYETKKAKAISYYRSHLMDRRIVFNVPQ